MPRVFSLMAVGVEGELHPQPPHRGEEHGEARERGEGRMVLVGAGQLSDRTRKHEVEEKLDPAGVALLTVVAVGRSQRRDAEVY